MIATLCDNDPARGAAQEQVNHFAARGFRSLAVAQTDGTGRWRLLGVLPLSDPPREDSADTLAAAARLGVKVKMVTGDQAAIGAEIAREVGLGDTILDADRLSTDGQDDLDGLLVEDADGFAQVFPEHKYRIVRLLQQRGHIVGMTGDGVNDAPALKQADAGIAVAGATDAARAAADVVLLAPGLSVIIDAIRLAREIFARMTSYATYRIAETIRVLLLVVLTVVAVNFFPVTATMIVLLAILNDGAILAIAYDHVRGSDRPAAWDMRTVLTVATTIGLMGVLETFLLFALADHVFGLDRDIIRTLIYLKLSVSGHLTIFVTRARGPFWSRPAPSPMLLGAVLGTQALATLIAAFGMFDDSLGLGLGRGRLGLRPVLVSHRRPGQARRPSLARSPPAIDRAPCSHIHVRPLRVLRCPCDMGQAPDRVVSVVMPMHRTTGPGAAGLVATPKVTWARVIGNHNPGVGRMSEHPNVARIKGGYAAFASGDFVALNDVFAEDLLWHEKGHNQLSGDCKGRDAVYAHFGKLAELLQGHVRWSWRRSLPTMDAVSRWCTRRPATAAAAWRATARRSSVCRTAKWWSSGPPRPTRMRSTSSSADPPRAVRAVRVADATGRRAGAPQTARGI